MKKLLLLVTIATLSVFSFTAQAEEAAKPAATEQVATPVEETIVKPTPMTDTEQAAASADSGEKKAEGEAAPADAKVPAPADPKAEGEKKAKGDDEPDCN